MSFPGVEPMLPAKPVDRFKWVFTALVAVIVLWAATGLDVKWSRLLDAPADMWTLARLMFSQMQWSEVPDLVSAMWQSIAIAWLGTLIAAAFAIPMSFLAAENLVGRPVAWITRQIFNLLRAVPEIILALAFIPLLGLTPMAGVMAIAIGSIGTLGKLFYEILEGVRPGPLEAADSVGATTAQRLRWGVLPQVTPELASFVLYRFEVNIRASAVMGLVGAGGIGADLAQALRFKEYGTAGLGLIIVVVGTIAVDFVSGIVRRRIVGGRPVVLEDARAGEVYVP
jgi:phosphonate transport system permease protein